VGGAATHRGAQVRFCRCRVTPTGELGYSGIRGAVGLGYRSTAQAFPFC
jgi:hypothetical protein